MEALLRKLPSPDDPLPERELRTLPGRAAQLRERQVHELITAYRAGAKVHLLSRRFGVSRSTVNRILQRHGVAIRMPGLGPEQIEEAVRLYHEEGWSLARIGKHMGVLRP